MAYPFKVSGACASVAKNVRRIEFSRPLSSVPNVRAYDNAATYPTTDSTTTSAFRIFAGTAVNSNTSMLIYLDTKQGGPAASTWWTGATSSSSSTVQMEGDTAFLTFRYSASSMVAGATLTMNAIMVIPSDINPTADMLHNVVCRYTFTGSIPTVQFHANNETAGGTEATPVWGTITTDTHGIKFASGIATLSSIVATIPLTGTLHTKSMFVTT
jgi:hypothetical protein